MTARGSLSDSCGGTPLSTFMLNALCYVGPRWLQAQPSMGKN